MIASALKNGIILVLIILIIHFFLKNYLYDQELEDDGDTKEHFDEKPTRKESKPPLSAPQKRLVHKHPDTDASLLSPQDVEQGMKNVHFQPPKPVEDPQLFDPLKDDQLFQFILEGEKKTPAPKSEPQDANNKAGADTSYSQPFDRFFQTKSTADVEPANNDSPTNLDDFFKSTQVSSCS